MVQILVQNVLLVRYQLLVLKLRDGSFLFVYLIKLRALLIEALVCKLNVIIAVHVDYPDSAINVFIAIEPSIFVCLL